MQSGTLAGRAAADFLGDCAGALDGYEEELGDIFDAALNRALRRRRDVLACYAGRRPAGRARVERRLDRLAALLGGVKAAMQMKETR